MAAQVSDFFSDVLELIEKSPLYGKGAFLLNVRYAVDDEGVIFELTFSPEGDSEIKAKWIIDLPAMHEEGATHRELVQKGLDAIYEAFRAR
jgi:hypothetical protein